MNAAGPSTPAAPGLPRILGPIRPRPRWREARLLAVVAVAIVVESVEPGEAPDPPAAEQGGPG